MSLVESDTENDALRADSVATDLLEVAAPRKIKSSIVDEARSRVDRGNPPGKKGSLGDAINWAWLLEEAPEGEDLIIISLDGDYKSPLTKTKVREFLMKEWFALKKSRLKLYKTLPSFLREQFPNIKLSDEIAKASAIERLKLSGSYSETHSAVALLDQFADFTKHELEVILLACIENGQIYRILEDEDVANFTNKILKLAQDDLSELARALKDKSDIDPMIR